MTKTHHLWRVASAVVLFAFAAARPAAAQANDPKLNFERYKLPNGLEVILHQDKSVPIVAVDVWYHVASGNETPGHSGFAHLFEHMLFQGSKHVGEDKHFAILKNIGATTINGTTNTDRTNYFEVVPSNQLETALWLESDRIGYLLPMLTKKSLENQIEVVRNEKRQSYDNRPYGRSYLELFAMLYPPSHPYHGTTIGSHKDLAHASVADVKNFYKRYYVPANATLTLAGDFEIADAKRLVKKWFGSFPKSTKPKMRPVPMPMITHKRATIKDRFARLRKLTYAWHTPGSFKPGDAEFDIISTALGARGTGRLFKRLVHKEQLATRVSVYQDSMGYSSVFAVDVMLKPGADLARVERIVNEELAKVRKNGLTAHEIKRVVVQQEARFVWGLQGLLARANTLQSYNHFVGKPDYISQDLDRYRKATNGQIRDYAAKYLVDNRRVELLTIPGRHGHRRGHRRHMHHGRGPRMHRKGGR